MKSIYQITGWLFVLIMLPFIILGTAVALCFFAAVLGFQSTAKFLSWWQIRCK